MEAAAPDFGGARKELSPVVEGLILALAVSPRRLSTSTPSVRLWGLVALAIGTACGDEAGDGDNGPTDGSAAVSLLSNEAGALVEWTAAGVSASAVATAPLDPDNLTEVIAAGSSLSLLRWRANAFDVYDTMEDLDTRIAAGGNILDSSRPDVAALGSGGLTVIPVDADGNFDVSLRSDVDVDACWMALMDFDGDDDFDVVTAGAQLQLHEGRPGGLQPPVVMTEVAGTCHPDRFAVADLNGDGRPDVVYGSDQWVNLVLNNGTSWATDQFEVGGTISALAAGDLDRDFDDDLLISYGSSSLEVMAHVQGILFESVQRHALDHGPLHLFDLQSDGNLDLLTVRGGAVVVYGDLASDSPATLAELVVPAAQAALDLVSGDIDGDGDLDVVMTNEEFQPGG